MALEYRSGQTSESLYRKLQERKEQHNFRELRLTEGMVDFCSNDYLGIATQATSFRLQASSQEGENRKRAASHGSKGSRLLSGNYPLIEETEKMLAAFHHAEAGLIFNSGYDANLGLLSCLPQRGDFILYDQLSHASIRDGIRLSFARAFSFNHNDLGDLQEKLDEAVRAGGGSGSHIFVVTESVFSMDGDQAPLAAMSQLCLRHGAHLIVDEAHATGVVGVRGEGLVQSMALEDSCLARIHTFGKAVGCHGAIILGSHQLRDWLINFSRPFIYTTALPESAIEAVRKAYELFPGMNDERERLRSLIRSFRDMTADLEKPDSHTPIQALIIPGNEKVKMLAQVLQADGLDIRPILYPTVPKSAERLRIVLHSFNSDAELERLVGLLRDWKADLR
jgi:8-amino-7-oxononanoate synthase